MRRQSISFVIAGYNESENVIPAVSEVWKVLSENFENFEIILVNDGSKDDTLAKMKECQEKYPKIRVLDNLININFGASVLRGLKAASKEYVVYDAFDLPLKPKTFVDKFDVMIRENVDVLVLERESYIGTFWRKCTSNINRALLKILFPKLTKGTPVLNYTQIYKTSVINDLVPLARSPIFVWPELVFRAKLAGLKVENIRAKPFVKNIKRGAFGHPHDIMWGIYEMLRFRIRLWKKNY